MNNVRGLYPPLYGALANGGGGGGGSIQVETLPEASLEYKNKIVQYTGATTETLTNGYFYKCVEHTVTEGDTITVTYSWDNIDVMNVPVPTQSGVVIGAAETKTNITYNGKDVYSKIIGNASLPQPSDWGTGTVVLLRDSTIDDLLVASMKFTDNNYNYRFSSCIQISKAYGEITWNPASIDTLPFSGSGNPTKELTILYTKK